MDTVKLNFDGSVIQGKGAAGFILRNSFGQLMQAESCSLGSTTVLISEALALKNVICADVDLGIKSIIIEGDNKILLMHFTVSLLFRVLPLIRDVRMYLQHFHEVRI